MNLKKRIERLVRDSSRTASTRSRESQKENWKVSISHDRSISGLWANLKKRIESLRFRPCCSSFFLSSESQKENWKPFCRTKPSACMMRRGISKRELKGQLYQSPIYWWSIHRISKRELKVTIVDLVSTLATVPDESQKENWKSVLLIALKTKGITRESQKENWKFPENLPDSIFPLQHGCRISKRELKAKELFYINLVLHLLNFRRRIYWKKKKIEGSAPR